MSERTGIEWTDATWNPWYGCLKVSPGCRGCYMYRDMAKYGRNPLVVTRSKTKFREPLRWKEPRRVFTCSWSDFFIDQADEWRPEAWEIIRATPHLTYQILTKRPEGVRPRLPSDWGEGYPNVWLGVSAENQQYYDQRVPWLLAIPARRRFVSLEPLLDSIDLHGRPKGQQHLCLHCGLGPEELHTHPGGYRNTGALDWVIVGGESGPNHRPMGIDWLADIVLQCDRSGVPVFVKQASGPGPGQQGRIPAHLWERKEFPS